MGDSLGRGTAQPADLAALDELEELLPYMTPEQQEHAYTLLAEMDRLHQIEDAQQHFLPFVEHVWPEFIRSGHHEIMADAFEKAEQGEIKRLMINMAPRHRLSLCTPVLCTHGWETVETVQPGHFVFAPDGSRVKVTGKSPVSVEELYEVTTTDGHSISCDGEHLWTVSSQTRGHRDRAFRTYSTAELHKADWRHGPYLPDWAAVRMPEADLPIDPYVLGVWLGDGSSRAATIGCSFSDEPDMRRLIEARGYETSDRDGHQQFGVLGLYAQLRAAGLLGNKHVPEVYFTGSVEQRMDLIRGLMDSDGSVASNGRCTFNQKDFRLAEAFCSMVNSMGCRASITVREDETPYGFCRSHRVSFRLPGCALLPRKAERLPEENSKLNGRSISITKLDRTGPVACIQVANEDGLFLAGRHFVVTHNTKSEFASHLFPSWCLGKKASRKIMQCSNTGELAVGFGRKVRNLVNSEEFAEIFPDVQLSGDSKAAGRWSTNRRGEYFASGVGGVVTGRGADILIIDDPHALHIDTPIATTEGWKTMGTVQIGDEVFGPDGLPTKVVAKSDVYEDRDLYAVTTSDGETIFADAKHLWNVRTSTRVSDPYRNLKTEEMLEPRSSGFMIPRHSAVHYPERDLPIDPWVLGAWLGDGTSTLGRMTAHPDDMLYMRGEFKRAGYVTTDLSDPYSFGVRGLLVQLRELGVLGNKHIPEEYLTASYIQRTGLLQGLMDTDGNVTTSGQCVFHNKDASLVDQVVELVRSLGRKCQRTTYHTRGKFGDCIMHRVTFKLDDAARMPRKRVRTQHTDDKQHRSITVEETGEKGPVQCITVAREDGLFLAGRGYVVTHNSEQEAALNSLSIYDNAYEWYKAGPRQRLQPGGVIVIVATRWHKADLCGRLLHDMIHRDGDEWHVIELPAILDEYTEDERPIWPGFWKLEELQATRNSLDVQKWQAQYQQKPVSEEGALVKREWWNEWERDRPPACKFVIQAWDTAFTAKQTSDFSACSTWGVWEDEDGNAQIILLDAYQARMEFHELKQEVLNQHQIYKPDAFLVEAKASGWPLIQELRRLGIPVTDVTPVRGQDKLTRVNAITDIFASGRVWKPDTRFADLMVEQFAEFPYGEHDDLLDTGVMALTRFRDGGFITLPSDEIWDTEPTRPRVANYY